MRRIHSTIKKPEKKMKFSTKSLVNKNIWDNVVIKKKKDKETIPNIPIPRFLDTTFPFIYEICKDPENPTDEEIMLQPTMATQQKFVKRITNLEVYDLRDDIENDSQSIESKSVQENPLFPTDLFFNCPFSELNPNPRIVWKGDENKKYIITMLDQINTEETNLFKVRISIKI